MTLAPAPRSFTSPQWGKALRDAGHAMFVLGQRQTARAMENATTPRQGRQMAFAAAHIAEIILEASLSHSGNPLFDRALEASSLARKAWRACARAEVAS